MTSCCAHSTKEATWRTHQFGADHSGSSMKEGSNKLADQLPMGFMLPETTWEYVEELPDLRDGGPVAIDLETRDDGLANDRGSGWPYRAGRVVGVSMASSRGSHYAPLGHPDSPVADHAAVGRWVWDHARSGGLYFNASYDLGWSKIEWRWNTLPTDSVEDVQVMYFLLRETAKKWNLNGACDFAGVPRKDETILEKAAKAHGYHPKKDLWKLPARFVAPYAIQDAQSTLEAGRVLMTRIEAQGMQEAYRLECDLIPLLIHMREKGIRIDSSRIGEVRDQLLVTRDDALAQLTSHIGMGRTITMGDVGSPTWLGSMFREQNLPVAKTAIGNDSFESDTLEKIDHWLPQLVVRARKSNDAGEKFVGTYINDFCHRGRIHAEANAVATATTRFSYSSPPLQQMPSRVPEIATPIRGLFLPEPGEVWAAPDYSQQEYRLIVHFAAVCNMRGAMEAVERYRNDPSTDFHNYVVEITGLIRRKAKDTNFAKAFGAGKAKFALMTGMTLDDASITMDQYDRELPFVRGLGEFCKSRADKNGYVKLIDGARSHFDDWDAGWIDAEALREAKLLGIPTAPCDHAEAVRRRNDPNHPWHRRRLVRSGTHKAMNRLIQGSGARQTKLAMRECWREGIPPLLQMHDELDFSIDTEVRARRVAEIMREVVVLEVPVMVDLEFGPNWGAAKHTEWSEAFRAPGLRVS